LSRHKVKAKGKVSVKKKSARKAKKKSARYDPQTGRPTGRAIGAMERRDQLAEKYVTEGMSPEDARHRAQMEMRDNALMDWRRG
jgi:hypothetical protein